MKAKNEMKIVILYTRLSPYWMACMRYDVKKNNNDYFVFYKKSNDQSPFEFESENGIKLDIDENYSFDNIYQRVKKINPNLIYVAGWRNLKYLRLVKSFKKRGINIVLGLDNHWKSSIKQRFFSSISHLFLKKIFTHIWIPGIPQQQYAKKLGFTEKQILTGLYCADESLFKNIVQTKKTNQFIFIGRLVEHKGIKILIEVLKDMIIEKSLNFKIHIIGNGPLSLLIPKHPLIKHTKFLNPEKLQEILPNSGFFLLPSLYEAWGVVIHEAVLSGLPVISTYQTGSTSEFVVNGFNGFLYDSLNKNQLKEILIKSSKLSNQKYMQMSQASKKLSKKISLNEWSIKINSLIDEK